MGFFKALLNINNATGIREATRFAYQKVRRQAERGALLPPGFSPHLAGLHGALWSRYEMHDVSVSEAYVSLELIPFFLMPENESVAVIAEYAVLIEKPSDANKASLKQWFEWCFSEGGPAWQEQNRQFVSAIPLAIEHEIPWTKYVSTESLNHCHSAVTGLDFVENGPGEDDPDHFSSGSFPDDTDDVPF